MSFPLEAGLSRIDNKIANPFILKYIATLRLDKHAIGRACFDLIICASKRALLVKRRKLM